MRRLLYIPGEVKGDIRDRIVNAVKTALQGFESASEDEDTLTGHLGAMLKTPTRTVEVFEGQINGQWRWSLTYTKFRGRGPAATENFLGADGIFEIKLEGSENSITKSLLFQSKMECEGGRKLVEQCAKLSTWREAAFVLNFGEDRFEALSLDKVLAARGDTKGVPGIPLADYLAGPFLDCEVGDADLVYRPREHRLVWRAMTGEKVAVKFAVKHRFRLKVTAPADGGNAEREIDLGDIHKFRMEASDEEILAIAPGAGHNPTQAKRALSKVYHSDRWGAFDLDVRDLMKTRMQEVNVAYDRIKKKHKR